MPLIRSISPSFFLCLVTAVYAAATLFSMAVMNTALGILLVTWGVSGRSSSWKKFQGSPDLRLFGKASILLSIFCWISLIHAAWNPLSFGGQTVPIYWGSELSKIWYFFLPLLLVALFEKLSPSERRWVGISWLGFAAILGVLAWVQFFTGFPRPRAIPNYPERSHATLFLGHHLSVASIFIFPFFVSLSLAFCNALTKKARLGLGFTALSTGCALFLTWSRTLWVALPLGLIGWTFRNVSSHHRKWIIGGGFGGLLLSLFSFESLWVRFWNTTGLDDRFEIWRLNWQFFLERPWLGVGWRKPQMLADLYWKTQSPHWGTNHFVGHAHNNFLEILSSLGILGMGAWLYWVGVTFFLTWKLAQKPGVQGALGGGLLCAWGVFHLNGLTQVNFWEGKVLHQMMWVLGLTLWSLYRKSTSGE